MSLRRYVFASLCRYVFTSLCRYVVTSLYVVICRYVDVVSLLCRSSGVCRAGQEGGLRKWWPTHNPLK